jgi:hypothetical protein
VALARRREPMLTFPFLFRFVPEGWGEELRKESVFLQEVWQTSVANAMAQLQAVTETSAEAPSHRQPASCGRTWARGGLGAAVRSLVGWVLAPTLRLLRLPVRRPQRTLVQMPISERPTITEWFAETSFHSRSRSEGRSTSSAVATPSRSIAGSSVSTMSPTATSHSRA